MQDIIFDTDVLIHLHRFIPQFSGFLHIIIPPAVAKETRNNHTVLGLIDQGHIVVIPFDDDDRTAVAKLIKNRVSKNVSRAYLQNRLKKNAGEYEACYLAKKLNAPVIVFDGGAWNFARSVLAEVCPIELFPIHFIPEDKCDLRIKILNRLCKDIRIKKACDELEKLQQN